MKKNGHIHLLIETNILEKLKEEADNYGVTLSEICRLKLNAPTKLARVELLLEEFLKNAKSNSNKPDN